MAPRFVLVAIGLLVGYACLAGPATESAQTSEPTILARSPSLSFRIPVKYLRFAPSTPGDTRMNQFVMRLTWPDLGSAHIRPASGSVAAFVPLADAVQLIASTSGLPLTVVGRERRRTSESAPSLGEGTPEESFVTRVAPNLDTGAKAFYIKRKGGDIDYMLYCRLPEPSICTINYAQYDVRWRVHIFRHHLLDNTEYVVQRLRSLTDSLIATDNN